MDASEAVAIEDTQNSVMSAKRAGVRVVATPGEFTSGQDVSAADLALDTLGTESTIDARVLELIG